MARIFNKVMRCYLILAALLCLACQDDEKNALIQKYSVSWDSNITENYLNENELPSVEFFSLLQVSDALIVLSRSFGSSDGFITKTDLRGNFLSDIPIENEFPISVFHDGADGFFLISRIGDGFFRVRNFSSDLSLLSQKDLDLALPFFTKFFFINDGIIRVRSDDVSIEKHDLNGNLQWKKPMSDFTFPGLISPVVAVSKNANEFTLTYVDNDLLRIAHVDSNSGDLIWDKAYSITTDFGGAGFGFNYRWGENNKFYFAGAKNVSGQDYVSVVILKGDGSLDVFKDIIVPNGLASGIGPILPTVDNGSLIAINAEVASDSASFRVLKIDSKANAGWMGSFSNYIAADFVTGMAQTNDGEVVLLSYYGYMAGLHPEY
jgi:hypothetical protein